MHPTNPSITLVNQLPALPPRPADSNKGTFGRVLVISGSGGMSGAAVLCGSAALRSGAGLVRVAVPSGILPIVAAGNPCYMTAPMPEDEHGRFSDRAAESLLALAQGNSVVAMGPGFGRSPTITALVSALLTQLSMPIVLDADGLNALHTDRLRDRTAPLIMTPHPGEFSRLSGLDIPTIQNGRQEVATRFAAEHGVILVLKGQGTVVTDGKRIFVNTTGNPGMATAGSGDVLTGVIAGFLAQGLEPFAAAQLGVYIHGFAGDMARDALGEVGMMAADLLTYLPQAIRRL
jgi:ADP-dependent NAD(P)H-hydrate dehydratase